MHKFIKSVSIGCCFATLLMSYGPITGPEKVPVTTPETNTLPANTSRPVALPAATTKSSESLMMQAGVIYDSMHLKKTGLNKQAFEYAWKGYQHLLRQNVLYRESILSICDFSQSSRRKRLYIFDVIS